jgi:hypothetical protein
MSAEVCSACLCHSCTKVINHVCNDNESNVWHSRLCHINFGCMTRLANMSLILKFTAVKGSKCQVCVQAKQPRKSHTAAEPRNLAPLELIHSDLCEMNGVLTKGGKRYFMTLIDDSTRYCYVYLLKSKDEALNYFKIYKAEAENQLDLKIKRLRCIVVESTFQTNLIYSVWNTVLYMRGRLPTHLSQMGWPKERTAL